MVSALRPFAAPVRPVLHVIDLAFVRDLVVGVPWWVQEKQGLAMPPLKV